MSAEKVSTPTASDNSLYPSFEWSGDSNFCLVFKGDYFKQKRATFTPLKKKIFFIVYELGT